MLIKIMKGDNVYLADMVDLPGSPPIGIGDTKESALADLFFMIARPSEENWLQYVAFDRWEIIEI